MTNTTFKIGTKEIGNGLQPYIIAEMACAHDGDPVKAKKLVDSAVDAGADAVQLQFFKADETVTPSHEVFSLIKKLEFSEQNWTDIFNYARQKGIHVFVCTYDLSSVKLAVKLKADGIKLNSADLSNPEVLIEVASSGIPFTLGTGASSVNEIRNGIASAESSGAENIVLMHGVQNFPTKTEDLNISRIQFLKETFGMPVGYHDHTDAEDKFSGAVDLLALGMGISILEKHITLDRKEKGTDHQAALEPSEFKAYVQTIRKGFVALGKKIPGEFTESDLRYRKFQKKSIVAARKINAGEKITREDVKFIRNAEPGLPPSEFTQLTGKVVVTDLEPFQNILLSDIRS